MGSILWKTQGKWEQNARLTKVGVPDDTHHTRTLLIVRGLTIPQETPKALGRRGQKRPGRYQRYYISMAPDPMLSLPAQIPEKQGSKQKQQLTQNTEVGPGQGKDYVLVSYC